MYLSTPIDVAGPGVVLVTLALTLAALVVLFLLIVLIESVVLQLMRWDMFKRSLWGAFLMNLASTLVGFFMLSLVPRLGLLGLFIGWALSVLVEGGVLMLMKREAARLNWRVAAVANLASYLILLLPAFWLSQ